MGGVSDGEPPTNQPPTNQPPTNPQTNPIGPRKASQEVIHGPVPASTRRASQVAHTHSTATNHPASASYQAPSIPALAGPTPMATALLTTAVVATPLVVQHLVSQNAVRAAARLAASLHLEAAAAQLDAQQTSDFSVPPSSIRLVDDEPSATDFIGFVARTVSASSTTSIAIDAEWRPDTPSTVHRPSLLQLAALPRAAGSDDGASSTPTIWLLDLEAAAVLTASLLAALAELLSSERSRLLGFGLQTDLDKLQMLFSGPSAIDAAEGIRRPPMAIDAAEGIRRPPMAIHGDLDDELCGVASAGAESAAAPTGLAQQLVATRVVDLRETCNGSSAVGGGGYGGGGGGLSSQLSRWTGRALDKTCQCSDWRRRPLSAAQKQYAVWPNGGWMATRRATLMAI